MESRPPFHPSSAAVAHVMSRDSTTNLKKVECGEQIPIIIPDSPLVRCLLPIHFGTGMKKSRLCSGSVHCQDCAEEVPLTFHLYVGCYNGRSGERIIVPLGTAHPKRWRDKLPSFKHQFRVWRKTATSPILLEEMPYQSFDASAFVAWDVMPDVLRIFRGRRSTDRMHDTDQVVAEICEEIAVADGPDEMIPY